MTEPHAPYHAGEMSPDTMLMIARSLSLWIRALKQLMPHYRITEETWRNICVTALAMEAESEPVILAENDDPVEL